MAIHAPDALKERIGTLSLDKQEKIEADAAKAERKAEKKAETEAKKKAVSNGDNGCAVSLVDAHGRLAGVENHSGGKGMPWRRYRWNHPLTPASRSLLR